MDNPEQVEHCLSLIRNALMLATLCGGTMAFFKHAIDTRNSADNFPNAMLLVVFMMLIPFFSSIATAIIGIYFINRAHLVFAISCGLLMLVVIIGFVLVCMLGSPPRKRSPKTFYGNSNE